MSNSPCAVCGKPVGERLYLLATPRASPDRCTECWGVEFRAWSKRVRRNQRIVVGVCFCAIMATPLWAWLLER